MEYKFNNYLSTQKQVVHELIRLIKIFNKEKIKKNTFENYLVDYIKQYGDLLFNESGKKMVFKTFAQQKLGKKRIRIILTCLENQQLATDIDLDKNSFIAKY